MSLSYSTYEDNSTQRYGSTTHDTSSYCCQVDKHLQALLDRQRAQAEEIADDVYRHRPPATTSEQYVALSDASLSESSEVPDQAAAPVARVKATGGDLRGRPSISTTPYASTHYSQRSVPSESDANYTSRDVDPTNTTPHTTHDFPYRVYVPALITIVDAEKSTDGQSVLNNGLHTSHYDGGSAGDDGLAESRAPMSGSTMGSYHHAGDKQSPHGGSGSGHIVYIVRVGDEWEVRHRYSEFESLRKSLQRLYPTIVVPPIPEKHSLSQYAVMQSRTKDEPITIARRKRMLQTFLNRLIRHPILASEHILHRFLEPGVAWTEVLHSPCLTNLPKNPLHLSPSSIAHRTSNLAASPSLAQNAEHDGDSDAAQGSAPVESNAVRSTAPSSNVLLNVPIPSGLQPLRHPDARWVECEHFTNRFASNFSQNVERPHKRTVKRWADIASDYAELGAVYNGFSLTETDSLAAALEKVGQAVDTTFITTKRMVNQLESDVAEPMHEYTQFAAEIKNNLKYRNLKHLQMEQVSDTLQRKRDQLDDLEIADQEARRLSDAIDRTEVARLSSSYEPPRPSHERPTTSSVGRPSEQRRRSSVEDDHLPQQSASIHFNPTLGEAEQESDPWQSSPALGQTPMPPSHETSTDPDNNRPAIPEPMPTRSQTADTLVSPTENPYQPPPTRYSAGEPKRRSLSSTSRGSSLIHRLSYKLHGVIDVDPEATRRNTMVKTKESIDVLEEQQELLTNDLTLINAAVQLDLDQFQRQKIRDLRDILIAMTKIHIEWARKNKQAWQEVRDEVDQIPIE
ncbi:Sorting nexin, cytoplasm-to-vacuole targeting pathway/endosomal sorting [Dimargaris xerosporica]|nr:Sorting nexin, cytoplasm-to-vacuole targeting pathway/endosomal sorting [Dimargaris xerosporica]